MVIDVRAKGANAENAAKKELIKITGEKWERIPLSGALDPKFGMKGDIFIVKKDNAFSIEVKHYADSHINHNLITGTNTQLIKWVEQAKRQATQVDKLWLLICKHNRSKLFVCFEAKPTKEYNYMYINNGSHKFYISLLTDWFENEKPKFIKET